MRAPLAAVPVPSAAALDWAARRTLDMHQADEPGQAGRCARCTARGCDGLEWAHVVLAGGVPPAAGAVLEDGSPQESLRPSGR